MTYTIVVDYINKLLQFFVSFSVLSGHETYVRNYLVEGQISSFVGQLPKKGIKICIKEIKR